MSTPSTRQERASSAADPLTFAVRLKRPAYCPACGIGLQPFNLSFLSGHAFCKACGPDHSFVTQAAMQHMRTDILAPLLVCTDGLVWFAPPPEDLRGETIFVALDVFLREAKRLTPRALSS